MADNNFRAYRGRDAGARDEIDANAPDSVRDPLAELARLIGQGDPVNEFSRNPRRAAPVPQYDNTPRAVSAQDWPADQAHAEQDRYAEDGYADPQSADPFPPSPEPPRYRRDDLRVPLHDDRYPEPVDDFAAPPVGEPEYEDGYKDEPSPTLPRGRRLPALAPQSSDDEYQDVEQWQDEADDRTYASEDYDEDTERAPRRSGMVLIMAVLGLVIIGVASAFAFRTMFGGVLLPTLPPIIQAGSGPIKVVPAPTAASANADSSTKSGEKLVSREEQPVPIQPQNPPPRVVATIPVAPGLGAAPPVPQSSGSPAPASQSAFPPPPAPSAPAAAPAPASTTEPKKIHTVLIRPDQSGPANGAAAAPAAPAARPSAPVQAAPKPAPAPAVKPAGNAPLAIVPIAEGRAAPVEAPKTQVARRETSSAPLATAPTAAANPSAAPAAAPVTGGYTVQVTSQRSEAEAEAAYKSLQAKFPAQLGSHHAMIHRADLGEKGTYYRALVGPFASSEAAAGLSSNLKAAGGSCIVQKN